MSTCASREEAEAIATRLVTDGTAACVNLIDKVTSIFQWKGKIEQASEVLLIIKTRSNAAGKVEETIRSMSSYECPEVIVLPVSGGAVQYLDWLESTVRMAAQSSTTE
ncbi:MAG: divalent-cation tolerance protein CutA [candidate division Zixibacteria bacterium]|nr:divalent-cation tolerance protein CutA [candidate division Zixibacteria bacterium]